MAPAKSNPRGAPGSGRGSKRGNGGLGRGLAGILGDNRTADEVEPRTARGLLQLVGGQGGARMAEIGRFVVETALASVADGFGAEGLLLVGRGRSEQSDGAAKASPISIAPRLPPSWTVESAEIFEIHGLLWRELDDRSDSSCPDVTHLDAPDGADDDGAAPVSHGYGQQALGEHWVLTGRIETGPEVLATAIVRDDAFTDTEISVLAAVLESMVGTVARSEEPAARPDGLSVSVRSGGAVSGQEIMAEVTTGPTDGRLIATGRGPDEVTAVARAAANACRPQCEIVFAGSSPVESGAVSVVMVSSPGGLRFGFAVADDGDPTGVAAAVFAAAG